MVIKIHLFSKLFLDLRRTAANGGRGFVLKTYVIATLSVAGTWLNGSVAAHLSGPRTRIESIYEALLCPSTSVSSSPPSVTGYGRTYSVSKVNDSRRQVCLLVGCLVRCLWTTSHQHRHLEPPRQRGHRQASGTATVSSRNRSWGFPSSLRLGSGLAPAWHRPGSGLAPAWRRRLRPRARLPSLLPLPPPPFSF